MPNPNVTTAAQPIQGKTGDGKAPSLMIPIFKLPVLLYRLRLGWLLGHRFMQITHVGRKSGKVRRTVLAVLHYDEQTQEIYAVSAWKGSDWYSNIQATPAQLIETGSVRYIPQQRSLTPQEIAAAFIEFRKQHPYFGRMVCRIPGWNWDATEAEFLELASTLHGMAFRPQEMTAILPGALSPSG
jgi:deazaflavin-dependent oxidoreductase (nitroreductase family)